MEGRLIRPIKNLAAVGWGGAGGGNSGGGIGKKKISKC